MLSFFTRIAALSLLITLAGVVACNAGEGRAVAVPNPAVDATLGDGQVRAERRDFRRMLLGYPGGFQHVKGVISATSGYSGGEAKTAEYERVSNGDTGHADR